MRRAFFQSLIAAFYLGLSGVLSAADAADRWVRLASQQVEGTHQTTRIDLVKLQGRYKAIRLVMRRGNAVLNRILVGYGNGQIHYEDRPINLKAGERTRPIDARDENRFLDHVEIVVETSNKGAVVEIWGLQDDKRRGDVAALHSSRNHEIPTDLTVRPTSPTPSTTFPDRTVSGNLPVRPTVDQPSATAPGQTTEGGDVLFGAQNVGFGVDRDVIRAGSEVGKFDRIRLRVLENDIHINELKVVYGNGETDSLAINADIPKNSRTNWIDLKGDRFIKEIQMDYRSKPNFHGQARVEVFGEYAQGWLGPQGEGRKYNQGWVLLGAQTAGFVGFDKDTMPVGRNEGGFRIIRVNVRDRAITLHDLKVIYTDGSSDVIPIGKKIDAGGSYGPIDLKGGQRPIDHVEVKYRSRFFDASAKGKGPAIVEI